MSSMNNFNETIRILADKINQDQKNLDYLMAQKSEAIDKVDKLAVTINSLISSVRDTKKAIEILQRAMAGE